MTNRASYTISALVAILLGKPQAESFAPAIEGDPKRLIGAFTVMETGIVMEARKGTSGGREFDRPAEANVARVLEPSVPLPRCPLW